MDVVSPFFHLVVKSLVVLFPLTVGWLAFRRLALSKSANAWIYAGVCLFSAVTAAGILPWGLGLTSLNWVLLFLALFCPVIWIAAVFVCDMSRVSHYHPDPLFTTARTVAHKTAPKLSPLILGKPEPEEKQILVFRHRPKPKLEPVRPSRSKATKTILKLARDIRGNASSERRRTKLLPAPKTNALPFIREHRSNL
ncbi:MAG: hypothetical protein AAF718_05375 [Pseudomonadota bacterium]